MLKQGLSKITLKSLIILGSLILIFVLCIGCNKIVLNDNGEAATEEEIADMIAQAEAAGITGQVVQDNGSNSEP